MHLGLQFNPEVARDALMPNTSLKPRTTAPNSASPLLRVIFFCVLAQCLSKWVPSNTAPPEVLRLVATHPAKSESVYALSTERCCHGYSYTTLLAPAR